MWGHYGPKGMKMEKDGLSSVQASPNTNDMSRPYVLHDITSYFTILVGIYFPSVTGNVIDFYLGVNYVITHPTANPHSYDFIFEWIIKGIFKESSQLFIFVHYGNAVM